MQQQYTKPVYIFFLIMPMGISNGFVTVTLPFLLTKNGFPVALTAGIVAIGLSANLWRFVRGPIVDLSLSLHKWYWLSLLACIAALFYSIYGKGYHFTFSHCICIASSCYNYLIAYQ